jgi:RNA polymerase sigma-70 factor (ECF subfamily)
MESAHRQPDSLRGAASDFATTQWSLVLAAGETGTPESSRALERLCRAYWPPLYAYVRGRVADVHEAQDLTQAFFERLLEKRYLTQADPERGRFRAFLITAFRHFLSKEWARARTQKRGGGQVTFTLDFDAYESAANRLTDALTAQRIYERQWAITLLERVMQRLRREMERAGKGEQFQTLKGLIGGSGETSYAEAAARLKIAEPAARMAASRMRGRYRELLREEIAQTVATAAEIDDEIQQLFNAFAE